MKPNVSPIALIGFFLASCGLADQHATWVPQFLRQPSTEPQPEPEPDVKKLIENGIDALFTTHPVAVSVSRARRNDLGKGFTVCVKALVAGAINPKQQNVTLAVAIEHGALSDRRRANPQDDCEIESYQQVDIKRAD